MGLQADSKAIRRAAQGSGSARGGQIGAQTKELFTDLSRVREQMIHAP
jgi:hypothetical protein